MRALYKMLRSAVLGTALLLVSASAFAAGIAVDDAAIPEAARTQLAAQIEAERAQNPAAFKAVAAVKGHRYEVYRNFRNPKPTVARELRGLGKAALMPMLEALAFRAPERAGLNEAEWNALGVGMIDAVGMLRDKRAAAVLLAAFESPNLSAPMRSATARSLGRLGGDDELALLLKHAVSSSSLELFAIEGLGELRRVESAKHLASRLETTKSEKTAEALASALGLVGSSWAWKALGPNRAAEGLQVRKICAQALAPRFVRSQGNARLALSRAMLLVEHPESASLLRAVRPSAGATAKAVDELIAKIARQQKRQQR